MLATYSDDRWGSARGGRAARRAAPAQRLVRVNIINDWRRACRGPRSCDHGVDAQEPRHLVVVSWPAALAEAGSRARCSRRDRLGVRRGSQRGCRSPSVLCVGAFALLVRLNRRMATEHDHRWPRGLLSPASQSAAMMFTSLGIGAWIGCVPVRHRPDGLAGTASGGSRSTGCRARGLWLLLPEAHGTTLTTRAVLLPWALFGLAWRLTLVSSRIRVVALPL
jgi:hypothetical protein